LLSQLSPRISRLAFGVRKPARPGRFRFSGSLLRCRYRADELAALLLERIDLAAQLRGRFLLRPLLNVQSRDYLGQLVILIDLFLELLRERGEFGLRFV
ncbi:MAG: hypothetical protein QF805_03010, partial [Pirellulaceae bacterium]|nr:hypothetical protein [Pirellulaceae bacterium]